jgi:hypothetical protein
MNKVLLSFTAGTLRLVSSISCSKSERECKGDDQARVLFLCHLHSIAIAFDLTLAYRTVLQYRDREQISLAREVKTRKR